MSTLARSPTYFTRIVPKYLGILDFVAVASLALTAFTISDPGAATESSGPTFTQDQTYLRSFVQGTPTTLLSPAVVVSGGSGRRSPSYGRIVAYPSVFRSPIALLTAVAGASPPNRQADWPNPTLRKLIPQSHEDHSTIFDVTRPANEWVNPQLRTVTRQDWVWSSSLTLLAGPAQAPFAQKDWQNPRGYTRVQDWTLRTPPQILATIIPSGALTDWPNPRGARPEVQDWQWFNLPTSTSLQPPFKQIDWPNPRGATRNPYWSDSFKLPLGTVKPPYTQYDWPAPRGAKGVLQDLCPPSPLPIRTAVAVIYTLSPSGITGGPEFKVDQGYTRATRLGSQISLLTTVVTASPFSQTDWPNPRGIKATTDWVYGTNLPLTEIELSAAIEISWPSFALDRTYVSATSLGSPRLLLPVAASPFYLSDWPNPRGPIFPISLRTWSDSFKLPLTTVVGFNQRDWPNPRGAKSVDGFTQSGLTLALQPNAPFRQADWPVPTAKVSFDLRGWVDSFKLPLTTVRPPSIQRDWPVPKGHGPRQSFTQVALTIATFVPPAPPPAQHEWPNPLPYPPLKITFEFPASQNFWPPTPPIPPPIPTVLPRAKFIKTSVSGPGGISQVSGPRAKTLVRGPKGRTDASDP